MAAADCIEVAFFHHLQILLHLLQSNHKPCYWIGVMTVHPFEFDGGSIYIKDCIFDTDFPESNPVCNHFPFRFQNQSI